MIFNLKSIHTKSNLIKLLIKHSIKLLNTPYNFKEIEHHWVPNNEIYIYAQ